MRLSTPVSLRSLSSTRSSMYKTLLQKIYYTGLSTTGAGALRLNKLRRENKAAILNLHRISPDENAFWPPLHPAVFEELLRFLRSNFEICTIAELAETKSTKPLAALSFDDGYYDFIEYALPLLEKYGMRANMNVIPRCTISGRPIWNVRLYDFLNTAPRELINEMDISGFSVKLDDESPGAKLRFGLQLSRYLKNRPRNEREELWQSIEPYLAESDNSTRMMSSEEIRQIADETEIGVHSFGHESMGYESLEFFEDDLRKCRDYFDSELDIPLSIYAFPNGSYKPEQIDILRQNGIRRILLVGEQFASPGSDVLCRITTYGKTAGQVKMKALAF